MATKMLTRLSRRQIPFSILSAFNSLSLANRAKAKLAIDGQYGVFMALKSGNHTTANSLEGTRAATENLDAAKMVIGTSCFESAQVTIKDHPTLASRSSTSLTIKYGTNGSGSYTGVGSYFKAIVTYVDGTSSGILQSAATGVFTVFNTNVASVEVTRESTYLGRTITTKWGTVGTIADQNSIQLAFISSTVKAS